MLALVGSLVLAVEVASAMMMPAVVERQTSSSAGLGQVSLGNANNILVSFYFVASPDSALE